MQPAAWILPVDKTNGAAFDAENQADFRSMILRDRNHPSIFAWSLCNEPECLLANTTISATMGKLYLDMAHSNDPTRPMTGAMMDDWGEGVGSILDIQGFNYNDPKYDGFHKDHPSTPMIATETKNGNEDRGEYGLNTTYKYVPVAPFLIRFDSFIRSFDSSRQSCCFYLCFPFGLVCSFMNTSLFLSQPFASICVYSLIRPFTHSPIRPFAHSPIHPFAQFSQRAPHCRYPSFNGDQMGWWQDQVARPFMMGGFAWTGFDYKGESQWPSVNSHFGTLDMAGFPKDRFYYYKAWWGGGDATSTEGNSADTDMREATASAAPPPAPSPALAPVLHIFGTAFAAAAGRVMAFSNMGEVELLVHTAAGNTSVGRKKMNPYSYLDWTLKGLPQLKAGESLTAHGYHNASDTVPVITTTVVGAGPAVGLKVEWEMRQTSLQADGHDVALAAVSVVDAAGRVVTGDAEGNRLFVDFAVTGPGRIIGVGNGDPMCHEPDKGGVPATRTNVTRANLDTVGTRGGGGQQQLYPSSQATHAGRSAFHGLARVIVQSNKPGSAGTITLKVSSAGVPGTASITIEAR